MLHCKTGLTGYHLAKIGFESHPNSDLGNPQHLLLLHTTCVHLACDADHDEDLQVCATQKQPGRGDLAKALVKGPPTAAHALYVQSVAQRIHAHLSLTCRLLLTVQKSALEQAVTPERTIWWRQHLGPPLTTINCQEHSAQLNQQ